MAPADDSFSGRYPLHAAARAGDVQQLLKIIMQQQQQQQQQVNNNDDEEQHHAEGGAELSDIDARDQHRRTALHLAAFEGHDQVLTAMISLNANVSLMASDGITALHMAAMKCHYKSCKILVNVGKANCRLVTSKKKQNVLHLVASNAKKYWNRQNTASHENATITTNADEQDKAASSENAHGGDGSKIATYGSVMDLVKFFVKKKVDVFARDKKGNTPMDIASQVGVKEVEEFLKDEMQRQSMMKTSSMKGEKDVLTKGNMNNHNASNSNKGKRSGVAHDLLNRGSNDDTTEDNVHKRQKTNTGGVSLSHLLKDDDDDDDDDNEK